MAEPCAICRQPIQKHQGSNMMSCDLHFVHTACVVNAQQQRRGLLANCQLCAKRKASLSSKPVRHIEAPHRSWFKQLRKLIDAPEPQIKPSSRGLIPPVRSGDGQFFATARRLWAHMDASNENAFSMLLQQVPIQHIPWTLTEMAVVERVVLDDFLNNGYTWEDLKNFPELADTNIVGGSDLRPRGFVNLLRLGLHPEHAQKIDFDTIKQYFGIPYVFRMQTEIAQAAAAPPPPQAPQETKEQSPPLPPKPPQSPLRIVYPNQKLHHQIYLPPHVLRNKNKK